jgi:hypothetical protein
MIMVTMRILDVLQNQEVVHDHKDDSCVGTAKIFQSSYRMWT